MYYTGIGSRSTPEPICQKMTIIAKLYREYGFVLRSGAAQGADTAFEIGARDKSQIFIPWGSFSDNPRHIVPSQKIKDRCWEYVQQYHPAPDKLTRGPRALHERNICQVLGLNLDSPSTFVVYWAPEKNGKVEGGTATAITDRN